MYASKVISTRMQVVILFIISFASSCMKIVQAKRKYEEIRPGRHDDVDRFDEVYMIVRNTFLLAIAPVVISFLYGVIKDPDLPFILMTVWRRMTEKILGSLSTANGGSNVSSGSTNIRSISTHSINEYY
jgi:hypothetical protein